MIFVVEYFVLSSLSRTVLLPRLIVLLLFSVNEASSEASDPSSETHSGRWKMDC